MDSIHNEKLSKLSLMYGRLGKIRIKDEFISRQKNEYSDKLFISDDNALITIDGLELIKDEMLGLNKSTNDSLYLLDMGDYRYITQNVRHDMQKTICVYEMRQAFVINKAMPFAYHYDITETEDGKFKCVGISMLRKTEPYTTRGSRLVETEIVTFTDKSRDDIGLGRNITKWYDAPTSKTLRYNKLSSMSCITINLGKWFIVLNGSSNKINCLVIDINNSDAYKIDTKDRIFADIDEKEVSIYFQSSSKITHNDAHNIDEEISSGIVFTNKTVRKANFSIESCRFKRTYFKMVLGSTPVVMYVRTEGEIKEQ